jgi:acetyl-CoA carboxylase beta subunit
MTWFRKQKKPLTSEDKRDLASDVFVKCDGCGEILYQEKLAQNLHVCPECGHHMRIGAVDYVGSSWTRGASRRRRRGSAAPTPWSSPT